MLISTNRHAYEKKLYPYFRSCVPVRFKSAYLRYTIYRREIIEEEIE